jgi:hypothetical protein
MARAELVRGAGRAVAVATAGASLLACAACGTIQPQVAYPNVQPEAAQAAAALPAADASGQWDRTLAGLRASDQRVADVAWRIVTANAALCSDLRPQIGVVLQSTLEYSPRLRPAVAQAFHIDDRAAIDAVAAGSPAAEAGLRRDDILVAVNGEPLTTGAPPAPPGPDMRAATRAPVDRAEAALDAALAGGPAKLRVQRGDETLDVALTPQTGCAYDAQVLPGSDLNASADGRHVFISAALVDYAHSDNMLAVVLGHEFAHDVLHHHQREDEKGFARNVLGEFGSTPASHMVAEKEADYVGLYLAARAGYDISDAPEFHRHFPAVAGDLGFSHPANAERAAALAATRDEIFAKRQRGEPLIPNSAGDASRAN